MKLTERLATIEALLARAEAQVELTANFHSAEAAGCALQRAATLAAMAQVHATIYAAERNRVG